MKFYAKVKFYPQQEKSRRIVWSKHFVVGLFYFLFFPIFRDSYLFWIFTLFDFEKDFDRTCQNLVRFTSRILYNLKSDKKGVRLVKFCFDWFELSHFSEAETWILDSPLESAIPWSDQSDLNPIMKFWNHLIQPDLK